MTKTLLLTGSTDGLGLETAKRLAALGHRILLHGRNPQKLAAAEAALADGACAGGYVADLSTLAGARAFAEAVAADQERLDVLINNAGVFNVREPRTADGLDVRFAVNTIAPYVLTKRLLPQLGEHGRVVNLSSAAQAPVDLAALVGDRALSDGEAYAQSKLALTMWTRSLAHALDGRGPSLVAVNPGSFLGTKMVREAYGSQGKDIGIGVEILRRAVLEEEFASAAGRYFDNDAGRFADPHPSALDLAACDAVVRAIEAAAGL